LKSLALCFINFGAPAFSPTNGEKLIYSEERGRCFRFQDFARPSTGAPLINAIIAGRGTSESSSEQANSEGGWPVL
jgi:hypothetical protein